MEKIMVKNLRSLFNTGDIEIKPITVLVGRNSSGKSTFIRSFPLLKQSVETDISEPILWFGNYVDFGDFHTSLSNQGQGKTIQYSFTYKCRLGFLRRLDVMFRRRDLEFFTKSLLEKKEDFEIKIEISIGQKYLEKTKIIICDQEIIIEYTYEGNVPKVTSIIVNGENLLEGKNDYTWDKRNKLIPSISLRKETDFLFYNHSTYEQKIFLKFINILKEIAHPLTLRRTLENFAYSLAMESKYNMLQNMKKTKIYLKYYN